MVIKIAFKRNSVPEELDRRYTVRNITNIDFADGVGKLYLYKGLELVKAIRLDGIACMSFEEEEHVL